MSAWINTAERLPEMVDDGLDLESVWVLARTAGDEVYVAHLRQLYPLYDEPESPVWIARGPDGYELTDVIEWTEIPA